MSAGAHILIVDDDAPICDLLSTALSRMGHHPSACASAEAALQRLNNTHFDVVFCDIQLPSMQGTELIATLRKESPTTEVVGMTGHPDFDIAMECMRLGALDFLTKPFKLDQIQLLVERALTQRALKSASALFHACHSVLEARGSEDLPRAAAEAARALLRANDTALWLPDDEGTLLPAHVCGDLALLPNGFMLDRVVQHRRAEACIEGDQRGDGAERYLLAYPIFIHDRLLGVLALSRAGHQRPFQQVDLDQLGIFGAQLALTLENSRLVERMLVSERLASVGLVAAGVAHEIKQPIAWLSTNLGMLNDGLQTIAPLGGPFDRAQRHGGRQLLTDMHESLTEAFEGLDRINAIVADINTLARTSQTSHFNAHDALNSAIRVTRSTLRKASVILEQDLPGVPVVYGAPGRLSQVFVNLLANAAEAIKGYRPEGHIYVRSRQREDSVLIQIADDGPGIPPAVLPHIFKRYFTTKGHDEGTGQGLAICREIVSELGGTLTARSLSRGGAEFTVELPLASELPMDETLITASPYLDGRPTLRGDVSPLPEIVPPVTPAETQRQLSAVHALMQGHEDQGGGDEVHRSKTPSRSLLGCQPPEPARGQGALSGDLGRGEDKAL